MHLVISHKINFLYTREDSRHQRPEDQHVLFVTCAAYLEFQALRDLEAHTLASVAALKEARIR